MRDESRRCTATSKRRRERCRRQAVPGYTVCRYHGANPDNHGGCPPEKAQGNTNALKHGAYARRILDDGEQRVFDEVVTAFRGDFSLNDSSDVLALEAMAMAYIQYVRAANAGNAQAAETFDRVVRSHLRDLKATRLGREGETTGPQTTPAEWVTALLEDLYTGDLRAKGSKTAGGAAPQAGLRTDTTTR